jgi:ethanolaminephosphotransferase
MWRRAIVWNTAALVALVLYCVSLFASSYVEEEHQYWYFWTNSLWMVWIVTGPLQRDRVVMGVAQMACLRVLRSWNQTGQKWATQVDVKHYMTSSHVWLMWVLFALAALDVLAGIVRTARPWSLRSGAATISSVVGLLCTCLYKVATSTQEATAYATPLAWIVYAATILSLVHARRNTWTILLLFLSKPHNAFLFVVMERQFNLCKQAKLKESPLSNALLICLMYSSFYTFGNSNSIASIDLSNAYNGLQSYNATAVGLLTFLSNWAGPLWWLVAISTLPMPKTAFIWTWMAFHMVSTLVLAISVTILRHHLFIWSVFSPRFLYQLAWAMYLLLGVAFLNQ